MLLTYPENCVIETCGVVIPSTAGVSCKEPLMSPPINKLFWTATVAEETKRAMILYYMLHIVQGSPITRSSECLSKKWKEAAFLVQISHEKILWHYLTLIFSLHLRSIQCLLLWMFYNRHVTYCLSLWKMSFWSMVMPPRMGPISSDLES